MFRDVGETLISDPDETRVSRNWLIDERIDDPLELSNARMRDTEANRGSELVDSTMKTTTTTIKSSTTRRHSLDSGTHGWLWCSAIRPTNDDEWQHLRRSLPDDYDHHWTIYDLRLFARSLGEMVVQQLGSLGGSAKLDHSLTVDGTKVTHQTEHPCLTVFHGPVVYEEDPYVYVAEASTPAARLFRPLFVKQLKYQHQREYRFLVGTEDEPDEERVMLDVSSAMFEAAREPVEASPVRVIPPEVASPRMEPMPREPAPLPAPLPLTPETDPLTDSFLDIANSPHTNRVVRTISGEDPPADLDEKTAVYPAVETLRRIVGQADDEPAAAAAAWHAEPYIRRLCAVFQNPIDAIQLTDDNFIVIRVKFPTDTDAYGKIAIGPRGMVRTKIGRGYESTDCTSLSPPWGWPLLDDFERTLGQYGLPRQSHLVSEAD